MAVAEIKAISIVGLIKNLSEVITVLGKSKVFHPDDVTEFYSNTKSFTHITTKNEYAEPLIELKNVLELAKFDLHYVNTDDFEPDAAEMKAFAKKTSGELEALIGNVAQAQQEVNICRQHILQSEHFIGLGMKIESLLSCKYVKPYFGRLPRENYSKLAKYDSNPFLNFFICSEEQNYYWGVYITPLEQEQEINRIFSSLYFEQCDITGMENTPEKYHQQLIYDLPGLENKLSQAQRRLQQYKQDHQKIILRYYTKLEERSLYAAIQTHALQYNNSFCIVGWVPSACADVLRKQLAQIESVDIVLANGKDELKHSPPVKLKNHFFVRPFEFYTEMFGTPRYNEIDPTPFVAFTYVILFGIMFADVGHGLCLILAGWLMWKLKNMKIGKILMPCGVTSALFGCVFGSVFGFEHLLDPLYKGLFGLQEKPIEVMDASATNAIIFSAIGIGVFLLIAAMILGVYSSLKQKHYGEAVFGVNGLAGIVFYCSLVAGLLCQLMLGIPIMTLPYILGLIVLPLILIYLREPLSKLIEGNKNWKPEKWGSFLTDNFFELFEVLLSYVTNTMSFLRVGAFVLVHAGMMEVVFVIAQMFGSGGIGYWIAVILGNGLVMGLEALLVAIQVLRLEFYEMFSRFYSGDGRAYEPIRLENKN